MKYTMSQCPTGDVSTWLKCVRVGEYVGRSFLVCRNARRLVMALQPGRLRRLQRRCAGDGPTARALAEDHGHAAQ